MKRIRFRRVAKRDLRDAAAWHRRRDPELADRFLEEIFKTLALLEESPNIGGGVAGVADRDTRQLPVDTFPHQVVFKHYANRTGYWEEER